MSLHILSYKQTPILIKTHSDSDIKYHLYDIPTVTKKCSFSLSLYQNVYNNDVYVSDKIITRKCLSCRKIFKKSSDKFCSLYCYKMSKKNRDGVYCLNCLVCNVPFETKCIFTDFCSDNCLTIATQTCLTKSSIF